MYTTLTDVALPGQGKKVPEVCRSIGISEVSYYRWRREYGGLSVSQAKRWSQNHNLWADQFQGCRSLDYL